MYLEYFGFREKPFNVTPDPRFFYSNPVYQETYAGLLYGIRERKGFISLIGEVGTGKTTLLRKLMAELREPVHFVYLCYTTLTFEELLSFICADLGLVLEEKSHLQRIQALNDFLLRVAKEGGTGVLLVDEAQNLADDVLENLRLLSNLETASEKLLQIILVGQPELERKLAQPKLRQLKQRIAIQGRLGRLKEREVEPFILSRLSAVGYESQSLFTPEAIQRIATYSKGTPRLINVICDNALLIAYSLNQPVVQAEVIEEVARDLQLKQEARPLRVSGLPNDAVKEWNQSESDEFSFDDQSANLPAQKGGSHAEVFAAKPEQPYETAHLGRRFVRILTGAVLALALLGGAGAAIFPDQTSRGFFDVASRIEEWFGTSAHAPSESSEELTTSSHVSPPLSPEVPREEPPKNESAAAPPRLSVEKKDQSSLSPREPREPRVGNSDARERSPGTWKDNPVRIESKMTVFDLVLKNYGSFNILAIDLIRENNPHLKNLERIVVGEKIWLPPLSQDTLVREQPDNQGYQLILGAFRSKKEAEKFAQEVKAQGYSVKVSPRRIVGNLVVQRVEILGLQDENEMKKAWALVNVDNVFSQKSLVTNSTVTNVETADRGQ